MNGIEGRTALVTGGALRIGRLLCLALAEGGARVVVHFRESIQQAEATRDDIRRLGVESEFVRGDLGDADAPRLILEAATGILGQPDILINNASLFLCGDGPPKDSDEWNLMQQVNSHAPRLLSRAFAEQLPTDRPGDIVNLNDSRVLCGASAENAYTASKIALHEQTRELAVALAPAVRVNEVALGAVLPPDSPVEHYERVTRDQIPIGRFPRPDEVTDAVLFLLGNQAVTGQTIFVDGGFSSLR